MSSAVVIDEAVRPTNDVEVILERCDALPNETNRRLSRVTERLEPLEQKKNTKPAHASVLKERHRLAKKTGYPSDTDSDLAKNSSHQILKEAVFQSSSLTACTTLTNIT